MSKVFVVSEYGDGWDCAVGVCSTFERAQELKEKILKEHEVKSNISEDEYSQMLDYLYTYEEEHEDFTYDDEAEGIIKLFPDKNSEDIKNIDKIFFGGSAYEFGGVDIQDVEFYN